MTKSTTTSPDIPEPFIGPTWIKALPPERVDDAPDGPGLYAWYAYPPFGWRNWAYEMSHSSIDLGIERCRKALSRHVQRYAPPPLQVLVDGAFSVRWRGSLNDISGVGAEIEAAAEAQEEPSEDDDYVAKRARALADTLDTSSLREKLLRVLMAATPFISSPLYVGVASSLNKRLSKHVRDLRRFHDRAGNDPRYREELAASPTQNFATRAVARGFDPDHLVAFALDLRELLLVVGPGQDLQLRMVAEAAEWLLNRWHRPPLGRL